MEYGTPPSPSWPELPPERSPWARARPDHEPSAPPPEAPSSNRRQSFFKRRIAPIGAAIIAFLSKVKAILLLAPKVKLLVTAASAAVSIAAYGSIWGLPFAVGFVVLLFVHEMGHVIALRREGIKATPPMFIPFLGAVITARSLGDNALAEARVGLAGPILGSIGSVVCLGVWQLTGHEYWRALAYVGLFLNLFNLLPVVPLDGGRAMAAMTPWMWVLGFAGIVALAVLFPNPIILIIAVFAAYETYRRWQKRRAGGVAEQEYYRVRPRDRMLVGAVYLGLVALLVVGMSLTHVAATLG